MSSLQKLLEHLKKLVLTERLVDGQVSLDDEHGRASDLAFLENVTTTTIEHTINTTDGLGNITFKISNRIWRLLLEKLILTFSEDNFC